jgi:hypothetical protein
VARHFGHFAFPPAACSGARIRAPQCEQTQCEQKQEIGMGGSGKTSEATVSFPRPPGGFFKNFGRFFVAASHYLMKRYAGTTFACWS